MEQIQLEVPFDCCRKSSAEVLASAMAGQTLVLPRFALGPDNDELFSRKEYDCNCSRFENGIRFQSTHLVVEEH